MKNILYFFLLFIQFHQFCLANHRGFQPNKGQILNQYSQKNKSVLYSLQLQNFNVHLKKHGFSYDFYEQHNNELKTHRLDFIFKNYNKDYQVITQKPVAYFENHIIDGKETKIAFYEKVIYKNFYPAIDLEFYVHPNNSTKPFEYNFVLGPKASINDIQFEIKGAKSKLDDHKLKINLRFGELEETIPASWISSDKYVNQTIEIDYCQYSNSTYGLQSKIPLMLSNNQHLVIDPLPIRKWGSYYGANHPAEGGNSLTVFYETRFVDDNILVLGITNQNGMATQGAYKTTLDGERDLILLKMNQKGERIWATYMGGNYHEEGLNMVLDSKHNIYILGNTTSTNGIATPGAYQEQYGGNKDGFLTKFNVDGMRIWGTYFGGNFLDDFTSIAIDTENKALYIGGLVYSTNLVGTTGTFNPIKNSYQQGMLVRFDLDGHFIWSTFTFGSIEGLVVDNDKNIIFNSTQHESHQNSPQFNTRKGYNSLSKFKPDGTIIWTFKNLGNQYSDVTHILTDSNNKIILTGSTHSKQDIASSDAYSPTYAYDRFGGTAGFLKTYTSEGEELNGTYIGEKGHTYISKMILNENEEIIVVGNASFNNKIMYNGDHFYSNHLNKTPTAGDNLGVIMKFSSQLQPIWGISYGDRGSTNRFVGVDYNSTNQTIITSGWTNSGIMMATPNSHQFISGKYRNGGKYSTDNGIVVLFQDKSNDFKIKQLGSECEMSSLSYTASGANSYIWYDNDGNITSTQATLIPTKIGEYICYFEKGDESGYISIYVKNPNTLTAPIPQNQDLPPLEEFCFVDLVAPKATSSCGLEITGSTPQMHFDIPGEYNIEWTYTDDYGNQLIQQQKVIVKAIKEILTIEPLLEVCESGGHEVYDLKRTESQYNLNEQVDFFYYKSMEDLHNSRPIKTPRQFINDEQLPHIYVKGSIASGCSGTTIIHLETLPKPLAHNLQIDVCDASNAGTVSINLDAYNLQINPDQNAEVRYYLDAQFLNEITTLVPIYNHQKIYALVTQNGCKNSATLTFKLTQFTLKTASPFAVCKEYGSLGEFDLSTKRQEISLLLNTTSSNVVFYATLNDARNSTNALLNLWINKTKRSEIYATSLSADACKIFVKIPLEESTLPTIRLKTSYNKCESDGITIDLNNSYDHISWSTGEKTKSIHIKKAGSYSVTVTNGQCTKKHDFEIKDFDSLMLEYNYNGTAVTFSITNAQNVQYSTDGKTWMSNATFIRSPGRYTFYFKSANGCIEQQILHLYKDLPNFISPNGDGKNDVWDVSYIKLLEEVSIFDRKGRLIFHRTEEQQPIIWDGKYLNQLLPSDTYWYKIRLSDGKKLQGNILLKNK